MELFENNTASIQSILNYIENELKLGNLIILAGAGISRDQPSNKPIGYELIDMILNELIKCYPVENTEIENNRDYFHGIPFEDFCSLLCEGWGIREPFFSLLSPLAGGYPNFNHFAISALLTHIYPVKVITTNFDTLIESALGNRIEQIPISYTYNSIPIHPTWLAKIHGSIDKHSEKIFPITTIETVSICGNYYSTSEWSKYFEGKTLLVIGYSGQDRLDIMTALDCRHGSPTIIWIDHSDHNSVLISNSIGKAQSLEIDFIIKKNPYSICIKCKTSWFMEGLLKKLNLRADVLNANIKATSEFDDEAKITIEKYGLLISARLLYRIGMFDSAYSLLERFICNTEQDARYVAFALMGCSDISEVKKHFDRSHYFLALSYKYFHGIWDSIGAQVVSLKRGLICLKQNNIPGAQLYSGQAISNSIFKKNGVDVMEPWIECLEGLIEFKSGKYDEAYNRFLHAGAISFRNSSIRSEIFATEQLIMCLLTIIKNNPDKKIQILLHSQKLHDQAINLCALLWAIGKLSPKIYKSTYEINNLVHLIKMLLPKQLRNRITDDVYDKGYLEIYPFVPMAMIHKQIYNCKTDYDLNTIIDTLLEKQNIDHSIVEIS
jgi:hypothetical protein